MNYPFPQLATAETPGGPNDLEKGLKVNEAVGLLSGRSVQDVTPLMRRNPVELCSCAPWYVPLACGLIGIATMITYFVVSYIKDTWDQPTGTNIALMICSITLGFCCIPICIEGFVRGICSRNHE